MVLALLCSTLCHFWFCNHSTGDERAGCFTVYVFWMSYCCYLPYLHSAVAWSVMNRPNRGISLPY